MIIQLTEQQYKWLSEAKDIITEDVYVNNISKKGNKNIANLTYNKGGSFNKGNKNSADMLKTGLMDNGGGQSTYEVPLKGGLISYNITDINGTEVMHYFKRELDNEETKIKIKGEEYNLEMNVPEFKKFMETFLSKVNAVVEYRTEQFKEQNKDVVFDKVCIYPVPSSSNFNKAMTERIIRYNHTICNLPVQEINTALLQKNAKNLQKDEDFIDKNQDYYNQKRYKIGPHNGTHMQDIDNTINKMSRYEDINNEIVKTNELVEELIKKYYSINNQIKKGKLSQKTLESLAQIFEAYQNSVKKIREASMWFDVIAQKTHSQRLDKIAKAIKYTKGPSVEKRTGEIFNLLKENGFLKGVYKDKIFNVCRWQPINFQIKNLGNDVRMALKNYFLPNENTDLVKQEVDKANGGVIVVFDDNVSGGATLSDICMNLKNLGFEYLIPITFGKMRTSYNQGMNNIINKPENDFNY